MNHFIKNIISLCLCMTVIFGIGAASYAAVPFYEENEINMLFFGGNASTYDSASSEKTSYSYMISEYLGRIYNINQANVLNLSKSLEGMKNGYISLEKYENVLKPSMAFFTFSGSEAEADFAYAEGIIRKLYSKNDKVVVNFIVLPNGKNDYDLSEIRTLASHYGIYVHNLCDKEALLSQYGKFDFNELFLREDFPTQKGHDAISRIIINDLKTKNWYSSVKNNDAVIYENIILESDKNAEAVLMTKKEVYVSPLGNDSNNGEENSPLKTIEKAVEFISALPEYTDVTIYFKEGVYNIENGIILDSEISKNKKITFTAYNGEKVRFTNSTKIEHSLFKKVTDKDILNRLPQEARGKVFELNLNDLNIKDEGGFVRHGVWQGTPSMFQLIVDDKLQSIARWPNSGFEKILSASGNTFSFSTDRVNRWTTATEAWVYGYLGNYFADDSIAISKIDTINKKITVANSPRYAFSQDHDWSVINLLEEIDIPGEWFLDHKTNILYYFPVENFNNKEVYLSTKTDTLFTLNNTKDITFNGIIFDGTRGIGIKITDCDNTLIENCEIKNTGRHAVDLIGRNNVVRNSYIHDTGRGGVWISGGGDVKTLTPSNNLIEYCRLENVCNYARTYVPAIDLYGVGDRASHNQISSGLGIAIDFKGKRNIIEYNEIFNYMYEGGDIGTIYCGRSWTTVGTEIRYNYIHDCPGSGDIQAIYLDDGMTGVSVYGNVIENITRGIYLHFGSYNNVSNNVFANCDVAVVIRYPLGITYQAAVSANKAAEDAFKNGTQNRFDSYGFQTKYNAWMNEYLPNAAIWDLEYPHVKNSPYAGLFIPQDNVFEKNIYACKIDYNMADTMVPDQTFSNNYSLTKEELENFNLSDVNEVYGKKIPGFIPVDIENTGIKNKPQLSEVSLLEPLDGSVNMEASGIKFSWNRVAEAVSYELVVSNDKDFKDIVYKEKTYKNRAYALLDGLKYGTKTYYWKVIANGTLNDKKESKTFSFTTAQKEKVDKSLLKTEIKNAQTAYDLSVEGDQPGQTIAGAKDTLMKYIVSANRVFESESASQKNINKAHEILVSQLNKFNASKNYTINKIGISDMLAKESAWTGNGEIFKFEDGSLKHVSSGGIGYTGKKIENDQILKFRLKLSDVKGANWISFGLRTQKVDVQPWNTLSYIFLVKEDVIELQKFNGGKTFYFSVDNEYLENDKEYEIEFGAVTMGDEKSVRVFLSIDGTTVYDYIDSQDQVLDPGYFSIYSNGGKAEIKSSNAQ